MTSGPCNVEDCEKPATRLTLHGPLCETHRKRLSPSRKGGLGLSAPIQQKGLEPREGLNEAAIAYLEGADSEDDRSGRLASDRLARAAVRYASAFGDALRQNEVLERQKERRRKALRAMRKGVRFGIVPKLDRAAAEHAVEEAKGVRAAARMLGVSPAAIIRALKRRDVSTSQNPKHSSMHALSGPREEGES